MTKQPDILHNIVYPILVTTFLTGAISGFSARYDIRIFDSIWGQKTRYHVFPIHPFLTGAIIAAISGNRRYRVKKIRHHLRCREQYQNTRISCPASTDIEHDIVSGGAQHQDTRTSCCYIYQGRYFTCSGCCNARAPRRPHWPLPWRSSWSSPLVLGPPGLSVLRTETL
jgi:hypothetical protein